MEIILPPELAEFVKRKVDSGDFSNEGEVLRHAVTLLLDQERNREHDLAEFNTELQRRIDSLDAGNAITPEEARKRLRDLSAPYRKKSA